jgi:hypothetical protein
VSATTVIRRSHAEPGDVFIGRPSKWGNPFVIGRDGDRAEVVARYRRWIADQPELLAALPELRGRRLVCFCAPLPCHGDVLAELADATCPECDAEPAVAGGRGFDCRGRSTLC